MSQENETDVRKKTAEAVLKEQQAKKIASETDMLDLDFVDRNMSGGREADRQAKIQEMELKHKMDMQKEDMKRIANLDAMAFQTMHGDKNIGVTRNG